MLVKHELREDEELLREELVREVDGRVHDAGAVRADRVGDVPDVDRVQVLVVARTLHKDLRHRTTPTQFSQRDSLGRPPLLVPKSHNHSTTVRLSYSHICAEKGR